MNNAELIDGFQFFKTISFRKIINGFLLRASYSISKYFFIHIHWGKPEFISIEPTNLCNLKCPECPSGTDNLNRPRLFLSLDDFKTTINKIYRHLAYLQLFFQGEPFMHPKIYGFIKHAVSKNIYMSISTNGQFLNQKNCKNIVNSGLQRLIISIDGTTQTTYEKYRVGGSLNKLIQGVKDINEAKSSQASKTPFIVLQFIVLKHNEHQIAEVMQLAKKLNVKLQIKTAQIENLEKANALVPLNKNYSRYKLYNGTFKLARKNSFKCKRIWFGSVITAENQLLPCCFDKKATYAYNEKGAGYSNWKAKSAQLFRRQVWNYNSNIHMCMNCSEGAKVIIKKPDLEFSLPGF